MVEAQFLTRERAMPANAASIGGETTELSGAGGRNNPN
jgi:hypothetical protein